MQKRRRADIRERYHEAEHGGAGQSNERRREREQGNHLVSLGLFAIISIEAGACFFPTTITTPPTWHQRGRRMYRLCRDDGGDWLAKACRLCMQCYSREVLNVQGTFTMERALGR